MVKDALNRSWQLGTIQVDYNLPERFELEYKGSDNESHRPVMIHRAPFGSIERFVAVLLEHCGGNFPLWLTPDQVKDAIAQNDFATIQSVKGIGSKTAQRVVLDLKDKILKVYSLDGVSVVSNNTNKNEALSALETLGFGRKQAEKICDSIVKNDANASVETIIKLALKNL